MDDDRKLLGLAVPQARGSQSADVVCAVEQVTGGDTLVSVGTVWIRSGGVGRVNEKATLRLSPAEREELIRLLSDHRFADLAATLGSDES